MVGPRSEAVASPSQPTNGKSPQSDTLPGMPDQLPPNADDVHESIGNASAPGRTHKQSEYRDDEITLRDDRNQFLFEFMNVTSAKNAVPLSLLL